MSKTEHDHQKQVDALKKAAAEKAQEHGHVKPDLQDLKEATLSRDASSTGHVAAQAAVGNQANTLTHNGTGQVAAQAVQDATKNQHGKNAAHDPLKGNVGTTSTPYEQTRAENRDASDISKRDPRALPPDEKSLVKQPNDGLPSDKRGDKENLHGVPEDEDIKASRGQPEDFGGNVSDLAGRSQTESRDSYWQMADAHVQPTIQGQAVYADVVAANQSGMSRDSAPHPLHDQQARRYSDQDVHGWIQERDHHKLAIVGLQEQNKILQRENMDLHRALAAHKKQIEMLSPGHAAQTAEMKRLNPEPAVFTQEQHAIKAQEQANHDGPNAVKNDQLHPLHDVHGHR